MNDLGITLLREDQIWGKKQLSILKEYGLKCALTDFAILLGADCSDNIFTSEGNQRSDRSCWYWTRSSDGEGYVRVVSLNGH